MKNFLTMTIVLVGLSTAALAQEQQVYSPYSQPTFGNNSAAAGGQQGYGQYNQSGGNQYMVYPGREQYGQNYGYIPRHPGDYRDAVDRGQWQGGGGARMPRRSYNGY